MFIAKITDEHLMGKGATDPKTESKTGSSGFQGGIELCVLIVDKEVDKRL